MKSPIEIEPLKSDEFVAWEVLARGYKTFYKTPITDEELISTWERILQGTDVFGIGAKVDGELVGIAHYLFHTTVWAPRSCYLQDLFTAPAARGRGVARHLIESVARHAQETHADRLYWNTQQENSSARHLYDKIARFNGFIRYDYPI